MTREPPHEWNGLLQSAAPLNADYQPTNDWEIRELGRTGSHGRMSCAAPMFPGRMTVDVPGVANGTS